MPSATLLCEECWSLTTEDSYERKYPQEPPVEPGPETCDLCRLLSKSITAFRDLGHKSELNGADWTLPAQKLALYSGGRYPTCGVNVTYAVPVAHNAADDGAAVERGSARVEVKVVGIAELEITTPIDQNLPWTGFANATDISTDSASEECFAKINGWVGECLSNHQSCNARLAGGSVGFEGPHRLVDTGPLDSDPALRLIDCPDSAGEGVKYCALSYCWGEAGENYTTTWETYHARRDGIKLEELPRMFRDAVFITRRVGCRYLWIDSICIIQQDRLDWESEAPRMQLIYGNAYLVIAATLSPSPSSGMFRSRPPTAHFDFDCAGKTYNVSVKERVDHDAWVSRERQYFETLPLHSRAWAFQERLLGRRLIHYSPSELVWECKTHIRCECSGIEWPRSYRDFDSGTSLKSEVAKALAVAETAKHATGAWHNVVTQYTARNLTVPSDRLPALSGLAKQFAFPQMGQYLAGIWYSQLPDALDWSINHNSRQPDQYRAPSWSWASLEGPVSYVTRGGTKELELIEAGCTPAGEDPFGKVSDGSIVVKGEFGPANKAYHGKKDYDVAVDEDEEIWALKLNSSDWNIWHSMLLKRSRRVEGSWERVGLGIEGDACFAGRGKSVVRIV